MGKKVYSADSDTETSQSSYDQSDADEAKPEPAKDDQPKDEAPSISHAHATYHEHGAPHISLQHFLAQHAVKPDQLAGFKHFAKREHQGKRTIADWEKLLTEFNQRRVG